MSRCSLAALALFALLACRASDPQPLEFILGDDFSATSAILAGGGSSGLVAYTRWDGSGNTSVRVVRYDAAAPEQLALLGEVDLGWGATVSQLAVSEDVAAASGSQGITLIDLGSASLATSLVPLEAPPTVMAMEGRWLLAASGSQLILVDLEEGAPVASLVGPSSFTAILASQGTFFAFDASGYVHVTPEPTVRWLRVEDAAIRNFHGAFADGAEAVVAGPSLSLGRSRVVRLDLRSPASPVVLRSHEVEGTFAAFAWDGGDTAVIAVGGSDAFSAIREGFVVRESDGTFTSFGIPLPPRFGRANGIAAHADHLFALSDESFGLYAIR
jgi:hypothetical protein